MEHAADLETGAFVAAAFHPGSEGDTATLLGTLEQTAESLQAVREDQDVEADTTPILLKEVVADQGYHSGQTRVSLGVLDIRGYIADPDRRRQSGQTGITTRVSVDSLGNEANGWLNDAVISGDGGFVLFDSHADNLVPGNTNGVSDVFVRNVQAGQTFRVSVGALAEESNCDSLRPAFSGDGDVTAFRSEAWDLIPNVINRGTNIFVHQCSDCVEPQSSTQPRTEIHSPGEQVVFESVATGNPPPAYQWRQDGVEVFGATFRTFTIDRVGPGDAGVYDVVATNAIGSTVSRPATLRLLAQFNVDGRVSPADVRGGPPP